MFFLRDLPDRRMVESVIRNLPGLDTDLIGGRLLELRRASLSLRRIDSYLAAQGLSQTQFLVIMVIVREPERTALSAGEIAARLDVSRPVLSKALATMERNGLITRTMHDSDGRSVLIAPTSEGRARFEALLPGYFAALMDG